MADLLRTGAQFLARQQALHTSSRVTYTRDGAAVEVRAMKGQTIFQVTDSEGFLTRVESLDWIVRVEELELDGVRVEPRAGDRIHDGSLGDAVIYEVMDVPGEPAWRYVDEHRFQYRIHTKQIEDPG